MTDGDGVIPFSRPAWTGRELHPETVALQQQAFRPGTRRAYALDWRGFTRWLQSRGLSHETAGDEDLADYLAARMRAGIRVSTVRRARAGIETIRRHSGLPPLAGPETLKTLAGAVQVYGDEPRRVRPLRAVDLKRIIDAIGMRRPVDRRDRALLLVAWQAALRRQELVDLRWRDFSEARPLGANVTLRRSKGERGGRAVTLPLLVADDERYCPVAAIAAWRRVSPAVLPGDPLFLSARAQLAGGRSPGEVTGIAFRLRPASPALFVRVLRARLAAAGLGAGDYSAHSLRAGMLTEAAAGGVPLHRLREHSRHKRLETLLGYIRESRMWETHPARGLL